MTRNRIGEPQERERERVGGERGGGREKTLE